MNKLLIILLTLLPMIASAQPGVTPVVDRDGKKYYSHTVEAGNTLWGLQRIFGVSVEIIVGANPSLKEGLKEGQTVLIPVTQESIEKIPTVPYKVKKGETLYGLSKQFNMTIDDLVALNPELKDGLNKGQMIKITCCPDEGVDPPVVIKEEPTTPNPFVADTVENEDGSAHQIAFTFSDSTIRHIVMAHETLYSVSKRFMVTVDRIMELNELTSTAIKEGQVLIIPVKTERIDHVEIRGIPLDYDPNGEGPLEFDVKEKYKIALLLPFHLDGGPNYSRGVSEAATKFYMGARLAIDSLERKGLVADIIILDTGNDSTKILDFLADTTFKSMDLVIGPFFENNVRIVAEYCKQNRIRMVCPVAIPEDVLEKNRLVYEAVPSPEVLMMRLADHMLIHNSKDRIILVKPSKESDILMYEAFKERFNAAIFDGVRPILTESSVGSVSAGKGGKTVYVVPTTDRGTAMKFMNGMSKSGSRSSNLFVYGTQEWDSFDGINNIYKNKYNFHYASPNFLNYYTDGVVRLNMAHRTWYKTDLSKMAVQGYDVLTYFCAEFFLQDKKKPALMMSAFDMQQLAPDSGFENKKIFVVEQDEYELFDSQVERDD
ncbi:MAG: LysM repeat protein [Crocinitomicaceae bacterium]|jgi:LysM repeat protein